MVQRIKTVQKSVIEYVAYDGTVFTDENKCREYERKGADPNPSVRFFNNIVELVPSDGMPIEKVLKLATAYVVIDPERAGRQLGELNQNYHMKFDCHNLTAGSVHFFDAVNGMYWLLDNRIRNMIGFYNGIVTVCESVLGASAMEIRMSRRKRK